jgi:hypothetical protein
MFASGLLATEQQSKIQKVPQSDAYLLQVFGKGADRGKIFLPAHSNYHELIIIVPIQD